MFLFFRNVHSHSTWIDRRRRRTCGKVRQKHTMPIFYHIIKWHANQFSVAFVAVLLTERIFRLFVRRSLLHDRLPFNFMTFWQFCSRCFYAFINLILSAKSGISLHIPKKSIWCSTSSCVLLHIQSLFLWVFSRLVSKISQIKSLVIYPMKKKKLKNWAVLIFLFLVNYSSCLLLHKSISKWTHTRIRSAYNTQFIRMLSLCWNQKKN